MLERLTAWLAGEGSEDLIASHFGFNAPFPFWVCVALLLAAGILIPLYYWQRLGGVAQPSRSVLVALRTAVIVLVLFLALDPSIIAQRIKPGEQFVALLFDDSKSMRIVGQDGLSRGERLSNEYLAAREAFENVLRRKHQLARYRLGQTIEPLQKFEDLQFNQPESDLTGGVASALRDLEGAHISAVVLFTDGVQQSLNDPIAIGDLPENVPVFPVGVDQESDWRDIEVSALSVRRTDFDKSPVVLTVDVESTNLAGRQAMVEAMIGNRAVKSEMITITDEDQEHEVRLEWIPDREGWLEYEARVRLIEDPDRPEDAPPLPEERIKENNSRRFVVDNRDKQYRILYVSGHPNWQIKFVRRALEEDDRLKLSSLITISNAQPKFEFRGQQSTMSNPLFEGFDEDRDRPRYDEAVFIRLGAKADELVSGYPIAAEELFDYEAIIWGDVEREFFNTTQMELTRAFVEKRGGALIIMGGPNSLAGGNYKDTIIEPMLPVVLPANNEGPDAFRVQTQFSVVPTMEGMLTGAWSFDENAQENLRIWTELPVLWGLDIFPITRPGATIMAEVVGLEGSNVTGRPFYALQRYGEGRAAIMATNDTWQWQMRLESADQRHERFWRQIIRNLVYAAPEPSFLRGKSDSYTLGAPAELEFIVRDEKYEKREGLRATLMLTTPAGVESPLSVDESIQEVGLYTSRYTPEEPGLHRLTMTSMNEKDEVVNTLEETLLVEADEREFQQAQYNPTFLAELAEATGGAVYSLNELPKLAQKIPLPERDDADQVWLHLWHLPGFYVAVVLMLIAEWYLRRKRGRP